MLRSPLSVLAACVLLTACGAHAQVPDAEGQIAAAIAPLPEAFQAGATVLGYAEDGALVTLREGMGEMVCLADDPSDDRFHVACYHRDLEPFMARGRALRAEGTGRNDINRIREEEARAGTLPMPEHPAALYSLTGPPESFDAEAGTVTGASPLYVVYIPYATGQTTGLSTSPQPGAPWLMDAGKPWAHIMVVPKKEE